MTKLTCDAIASASGYSLITNQENIGMVSYRKDDVRINVYLTTRTVATCLNHPKKGKTQLFRRNVSEAQLKQLFNNPRSHTGKGYYAK